MADKKISQLDSASTPLAGTEVLPIVQSGSTVKVATDNLTVKNVRSNATSGILQVAGPAAASTRTMTVPDANFTAARTDAAQTFTGNQTLSTGNLVVSSGKGIDFSANTGAAGETSSLLNWYEEGTYTPTLTCGTSGTITLNTSFDTLGYTRIGRMVYVHGYITASSIASPTGELRLSIPFNTCTTTQVGERGSWGAGAISIGGSASSVVNGFQIAWSDSKSYVGIYLATGNGLADAAAQIQGSSNTDIRVGFWYPCSA
jgi:hypothetical protein